MMKRDPLQAIELQTHPSPAASVIWLHGLGADGYDFIPVVRELDSLGTPAARYVFPHAPTRPVTINGGYVMRAWYDILGTGLVQREDEDGIRDSQLHVEALIAREVERGTPRDRIVLAGFSQGGAITLQTGLRQREPLAGLMALSSYLPLAARSRPSAPGEPCRADLHGTRPQRSGNPAGARDRLARCAGGSRL
jgi:phospholipase/carboxylesterase